MKLHDVVVQLEREICIHKMEAEAKEGTVKLLKSLDEFKDEASDIAWGFGRLVAGIFGMRYVRVPGDQRHYRKAVSRTKEYGCKRSKRFLVNGRCPSE